MTTQAEGGAKAPDLPTLRDLLERVEKAEGANLALEQEIEATFGIGRVPPPAYTYSLDAATALMDHLLPGWSRRIETPDFTDPVYHKHGFQAGVRDVERALAARKELFLPNDLSERERRGIYAVTLYQGGGPSEPLALLAAVLKALIGQAEYPCPTLET